MSAPWLAFSSPGSGVQAQAQTIVSTVGNLQPRLRALTVSLLSYGPAGSGSFIVRDGAYTTGATLFSMPLAVAGTGNTIFAAPAVDIRAPSGTMSFEFVAAPGNSSLQQNILAIGDYVPSGYPAFATPQGG